MNAALPSDLAKRIELAAFDPRATRADVELACGEAVKHGIYGVVLSSSRITLAHALLEDSSVKVIGLVAFPWGAAEADVKRFEAETAIDLGAQAIEMVINLARLKEGDHKYVIREMRDVVEAADELPVTAALETSWLTSDELKLACELALDSGVHGVSTGASSDAPAAPDEIRALRSWLGSKVLVKAGAYRAERALGMALVDAGSDRLGVSDLSVILTGSNGNSLSISG